MDARTIFVTVSVMVLANGAVLANIQRDLPDVLRPSAVRWQIATLLVAIGSAFFAFGDAMPIPILVTIANCALAAGLTFYHWAIQRFYGKEPSVLEPVICVAIVGIVYWFSAVTPNFTLRVVLVSILWTVILGRSAWLLHAQRQGDPSRSRRMLFLIYGTLLAFVVLRAVLYLRENLPAVFSAASADTVINLVSPVVMALLPVVGTTAFTLMCIDRMRRELQVVAATDYLTGLANRRTLDERGGELVARARQRRRGLAAVVIDLDGFKGVNDTYGHAAGDKVLVHAANHLRRAARRHDVVVRSGGEEFVLLLDDVDAPAATAIAERIRVAIGAEPCVFDATAIPVTVSAGVAVFRPDDPDFEAVIRRADRALYRAKSSGRDRVEVAA